MTRIESYFCDRLRELKQLAERGDPWVFLCASAFIEYLAKLVYEKSTRPKNYYTEFLKEYFFKACPEYANFRFASGKDDLDIQMFHVLRCGIVHCFSLFPDKRGKIGGGRDRSILLAHRKNGAQHLVKYINNRGKVKVDAVVFTAEDFVQDIEEVTTFIFNQARKRNQAGRQLKKNIISWVTSCPPIVGEFRLEDTSRSFGPGNILAIVRASSV